MKQEIEWVIESFPQTTDSETLIHSGTVQLPIDTTLFVDGTKIDKTIVNIMSKM